MCLSYITKILRLDFWVCHYHWIWLLIVSTYNRNIRAALKPAALMLAKANIRFWFSLLNEDVEFTLLRQHVCSKCL
jgi:hypothetical protein